jgi:hypothetical protein
MTEPTTRLALIFVSPLTRLVKRITCEDVPKDVLDKVISIVDDYIVEG